MEPEHRQRELLAEHPEPVATAHVQQFVAHDGPAPVGGRGEQRRRQQHHGGRDPEGHRLRHAVDERDARPGAEVALQRGDLSVHTGVERG